MENIFMGADWGGSMKPHIIVVKRTIVLTTELHLPAFSRRDAKNVTRMYMRTGHFSSMLSGIQSLLETTSPEWKLEEETDSIASIKRER